MVSKILVGNKNDDPSSKVVLTSDAQRFADQMAIQLFETSAKDNINVEEVLIITAIIIYIVDYETFYTIWALVIY